MAAGSVKYWRHMHLRHVKQNGMLRHVLDLLKVVPMKLCLASAPHLRVRTLACVEVLCVLHGSCRQTAAKQTWFSPR